MAYLKGSSRYIDTCYLGRDCFGGRCRGVAHESQRFGESYCRPRVLGPSPHWSCGYQCRGTGCPRHLPWSTRCNASWRPKREFARTSANLWHPSRGANVPEPTAGSGKRRPRRWVCEDRWPDSDVRRTQESRRIRRPGRAWNPNSGSACEHGCLLRSDGLGGSGNRDSRPLTRTCNHGRDRQRQHRRAISDDGAGIHRCCHGELHL